MIETFMYFCMKTFLEFSSSCQTPIILNKYAFLEITVLLPQIMDPFEMAVNKKWRSIRIKGM